MMNTLDVSDQVRSLIDKAERSEKSDDALKFSQAACNAANSMMALTNARARLKDLDRSNTGSLSPNAGCSASPSA